MAEQCKYHPVEPAQWRCRRCALAMCDRCSPQMPNGDPGAPHFCHVCGGELDHLGGAVKAVSLWQRLPDVIGFPLLPGPLVFLVCSFLVTLAFPQDRQPALIMAGLWLMISGRYAFSVLEASAQGNTSAPGLVSITESASHGMAFKWFIVQLLLAALTYEAWHVMPVLGGLAATAAVAVSAAMMMTIAVENGFGHVLNLSYIFRQIVQPVNVPYAMASALLALILLGLAITIRLFADVLPEHATWGLVLSGSVYYVFVSAHMVGYLVFEQQAQWGISIGVPSQSLHSVDLPQLKAELFLKEGMYAKAAAVLKSQTQSKNASLITHDRYARLLMAMQDWEDMAAHADSYFQALLSAGQPLQALSALKEYQARVPGFKPLDPDVRYDLAKSLVDLKEYKQAVHVLNGMHKECPTYAYLPESYLLAAHILKDHLQHAHKAKALVQFLEGRYKNHKLYPQILELKQVLATDR